MLILPPEIESTREAARRAISPLREAGLESNADKNSLFAATRTDAGRDLPPYYLVYFLLVDLLGFKNLGQFEKVAWSVPIDFNGRVFLVEHRKLGVGVFARDPHSEEPQAREIVSLIKKGVRVSEPFFEWLAERAMRESKLNVVNRSEALFSRFQYFAAAHSSAAQEAKGRAEERHIEKRDVSGGTITTVHMPFYELQDNARWLALASVDAFFGWTEHVFIHIAILRGIVTTGFEVAELADSDWQEKFKRALDIKEPATKAFFDELIELRRQLRNYMAHGAFGKQGEAFRFHSGAGAVPLYRCFCPIERAGEDLLSAPT